MIKEAAKNVDPVEIVARGYWQFKLVNISLDSLISYFRSKRDSTQNDLEYFSIVAMTYMNARQDAFMAIYCDSIRMILKEMIKGMPDEYGLHGGLGLALACLGEYDAAIQEGEIAMELMPVDDCHWWGPGPVMVMASIYIMAGDYDNAIDKLDYLLKIPSFVSVNILKLDPFYEPFWNLPRFKKMIAGHEKQYST